MMGLSIIINAATLPGKPLSLGGCISLGAGRVPPMAGGCRC